jgi:hypothetical protein
MNIIRFLWGGHLARSCVLQVNGKRYSCLDLIRFIWCSGAGFAPAPPRIRGDSFKAITLILRPLRAKIGALLLSYPPHEILNFRFGIRDGKLS